MTEGAQIGAQAPLEPEAEVQVERSAVRTALLQAVRTPAAVLALVWLLGITLASVFAHQVAPYDPLAQDLSSSFALPSAHHLLGTDQLGRDLLSRLLYGGREMLAISAEAVAIALLLGVPLGLAAGYVGGAFDAATSFAVNILFSIPGFVLLLAIAFITNNKLYAIMAALGVLASATILRLVRASTQSARSRLYVDYARITALPRARILLRHVLPNVLGPLIVQAFYLFSLAFIIAASLSFLTLGFNPETPSWGMMVYEATQNIYQHGWLMVPVGVVLTLTVLSFNALGSALRHSLPHAQARSILVGGRGRRLRVIPTEGETSPPAEDMLLAVEGLSVSFPGESSRYNVVDGIDLSNRRGETLGLVGESGSGKTMTALALLGLVPAPGEIAVSRFIFDGRDLSVGGESAFSRIRGREIAYVSQEPMIALDPCFTIGSTLTEPLRHVRGMGRRAAQAEALELLRLVGIASPETVARSYPHQLSGGMAQRVAIALALTSRPKLLIADEPTTALDVTIQAEILDLIRSLQEEIGMTIILVTHDLGVVADMCSRVAVMYAAQIVEIGTAEEILTAPSHPYTLSLMGAVPSMAQGERLKAVGGTVPAPTAWPVGCRFADRCPIAIDECRQAPVPLAPYEQRLRRCIREPIVARNAIDVDALVGEAH